MRGGGFALRIVLSTIKSTCATILGCPLSRVSILLTHHFIRKSTKASLTWENVHLQQLIAVCSVTQGLLEAVSNLCVIGKQ